MPDSLAHRCRMLAHLQAQQDAVSVEPVDALNKLSGENCNHGDVLRALQAQLLPLRAMPAIRRALQLIEETLHPDARQ